MSAPNKLTCLVRGIALLLVLWPRLADAQAVQTVAPVPRPDLIGIGGFSSSLFVFKTIVQDDEPSLPAGGWRVAVATLNFSDGRQEPAQAWTCTVRVGMPLRAEKLGVLSASWAATASAGAATTAGGIVMRMQERWIPASFCIRFTEGLEKVLNSANKGLGAKVQRG